MIIFDLNGDNKLETTNTTNGVFFDHDNDGFAEASGLIMTKKMAAKMQTLQILKPEKPWLYSL